MSTNESIYGAQENWSPDHFSYVGNDRSKMFLIAYFGEGRKIQNIDFSQGSLKVGLIEGKLPRGAATSKGYYVEKPIDASLSYCGLGSNSVYSKLQYFVPSATMFENGIVHTDSRLITNFAFTERYGSKNTLTLQDSGTGTNGSSTRFAPKGLMSADTSGVGGNKNQFITPFAQIPIKNCVLCPTIVACSGFDETAGSCTDVHKGMLWDYLDDTQQKNYTTHPYILAIGFQPWYTPNVDTIDAETGKPTVDRTGVAGNNDTISRQFSNVAILSALDVANGMAANATNPDAGQLKDIYCYWFTFSDNANPTNNSNSAMIFGASVCGYGNGSTVGMLTTTNTSPQNYGIIFPHPNMVWRKATDNNKRGFCYIEYYDGLQEWIRRQIACFGLFFTDDKQTALNGALNDEKMFLGTLVNGIGNGDYTNGEKNELQPQWTWETSNDSTYDAKNPPKVDPNLYNGKMSAHALQTFGTATDRYNLSAISTQLSLLPKLWDVMEMAHPDIESISYTLDRFLTMNPIDAIVSLQYLPVKDMGSGDTTVFLGNYDTQISALKAKTSILYDCGTYEIFPTFGDNWIDREVKITLYLPFCGTINLDPEVYMGQTIKLEYAIDLTTGTCSAIVSIGDTITDIASGTCAIDLPVTGIQQQTLNSELFNANENTKQLKINNSFKGFKSLMNAVTSINGNPMGAINGILGTAQDWYNIDQSEKIADYNLQHTMIPTRMIGANGGLTGAMTEMYPTIIFERPVIDPNYNEKDYGHSIGFACCETGNIGSYTGYIQATNVDLSGFNATLQEKQMIKELLLGGVYVG